MSGRLDDEGAVTTAPWKDRALVVTAVECTDAAVRATTCPSDVSVRRGDRSPRTPS